MATGSAIRFVVYVDNSEYEVSVELHKIYAALSDPDKNGDSWIVDESGDDYLYRMDRFVSGGNTPVNLVYFWGAFTLGANHIGDFQRMCCK